MKIYKITEASEYLGVSINTLKTLANNGKVESFKTTLMEFKKDVSGMDTLRSIGGLNCLHLSPHAPM